MVRKAQAQEWLSERHMTIVDGTFQSIGDNKFACVVEGTAIGEPIQHTIVCDSVGMSMLFLENKEYGPLALWLVKRAEEAQRKEAQI